MTEFDKLREAAEEIKLDDLQKQKILDACKNKKRRRINYTAIGAVAAVLVITVVAFSPGFYLKAGAPADMMENEAAAEDYLVADQDGNFYSDEKSQHQISGGSENGSYSYTVDGYKCVIFDADGFRDIYSLIPPVFISLVDSGEYTEWAETVTADGGMAIVQFVRHFGISKEAFDEANRNYARHISSVYGVNPLYFTPFEEHEAYEIFNTELIYTFDRQAIDEYYAALPKRESGAGSMPAEMIVPEEYYK